MAERSSGGLSASFVLLVVFVVLKLVGSINWSWFWVFCPIWINIIAGLVLLLYYSIANYVPKEKKHRVYYNTESTKEYRDWLNGNK